MQAAVPPVEREREPRLTPVRATALVALLALLSPATVAYLDHQDRARALSGSEEIGRAILDFHLHTGHWPVDADGDRSTGEISRLVGLPADQIEPARLPKAAPGAEGWISEASGPSAAIEDPLVRNRSADRSPLYPTSTGAPEGRGWNGPYLTEVRPDPWGMPYVCNVRHLDGAAIRGVNADTIDRHAVFCLSAGPDRRFDTPLHDETPLASPAGDDVGWAIQIRQRP